MRKKCNIVDTTLRDGEQRPGLELNSKQKVKIANILDQCGIDIIEGGIPAMGLLEQRALYDMKESGFHARIAAWNRIRKSDIDASFCCEPDIIHLSIPVSQRQIHVKLGKNKEWVENQALECVEYVYRHGYPITIGFEDASTADIDFMVHLAGKLSVFPILFIRFADTLGRLVPHQTYNYINQLHQRTGITIGFHGHNDLGMVVVNSIAAVQGGADYIDTTVMGIGERTGNCPLSAFVKVSASTIQSIDQQASIEAEQKCKDILHICF